MVAVAVEMVVKMYVRVVTRDTLCYVCYDNGSGEKGEGTAEVTARAMMRKYSVVLIK